MEIDEMIKKILGELGQMVRTESVVGKPIVAGDTTVIPVSRVSFGFGGGGGTTPSKKQEAGEGSGFGGGAQIEPIAFIVIHDGKAQLLNVQYKDGFSIGKVVDLIPELIEKVKDIRNKKDPQKSKEAKG